jgi:hypothetical protein
MAVTLEGRCLSVQLWEYPTGRTYEVTLQLSADQVLRFYDPDPGFEPERTYAIEINEEPVEVPTTEEPPDAVV